MVLRRRSMWRPMRSSICLMPARMFENITDARMQIRAVTIADYTFVLNTRRTTEMKADLAPETARPAPRECLVWVKQASYGNEYRVVASVGAGAAIEVKVETPVAPVVSDGGTTTEFRISSEEIAEQLMTGATSLAWTALPG